MSELDPENARILSVNAKMIIASKKCRNRTEASERHRIGEDRKEEKKEREKKTRTYKMYIRKISCCCFCCIITVVVVNKKKKKKENKKATKLINDSAKACLK